MDVQYKCGYCHFLINSHCADYLEHECFGHFNREIHELVADENNVLTVADKATNKTVQLPGSNCCSFEELLIKSVQDRPALYNFHLPLTDRTVAKKNALWQEIKNSIASNMTVEELKAKFKYLRDCYFRAKKKVNQYIPSGSAAGPPRDPGFRYFNAMKFLDDATERSQTISSVLTPLTSPETPSTSTKEAPETNTTVTEGTPVASRKRKNQDSLSDLETTVLRSLSTPLQTDGVDGFLLRLGESLRRFPWRQRARLEIDIMSMVFERELELNPNDV